MTVDQKVVTTYDAAGRKASDSVIAGGTTQSVTQYSYDSVGRLDCTAMRMNAAAFGSLPASACSLGIQGSFGPDRITRNLYDIAGQLTTVQRAYGVTTANGFPATLQQNYARYEYTNNGQRLAVIDANGNRAEMRYDGHDRQSCWIFPGGNYSILEGPTDNSYRLERHDTQFGNDRTPEGRTQLRFHPSGTRSIGCISCHPDKGGAGVGALLRNTRTSTATVDYQGRIPFRRTEQVRQFGTMRVSWGSNIRFDKNTMRVSVAYPGDRTHPPRVEYRCTISPDGRCIR
jgi:YD repeat-containing protein